MLPAIENDERRLAVSITGNLGSDGGTQAAIHNYPYQGRQVSTFYTTDGVPRDPPVTPSYCHRILNSSNRSITQLYATT